MSKRILNPDADCQYLHVIFKAVGKGHGSDPYLFCIKSLSDRVKTNKCTNTGSRRVKLTTNF